MRYDDFRRSDSIDDRRDDGGGMGGGRGGFPMGGGGLGIGTVIILGLVGYAFGIDPRVLIENLRRTAERPEDEPELTLFESLAGLGGQDQFGF